MKFTLIFLACAVSVANAHRYGLIRVQSALPSASKKRGAVPDTRSLFDEEVSLAFRQLFGYEVGFCMSSAENQLSLSMIQAQLSMSLAPLSLSWDMSMQRELTRDVVSTVSTTEVSEQHHFEESVEYQPESTSIRSFPSHGAIVGAAGTVIVIVAVLVAAARSTKIGYRVLPLLPTENEEVSAKAF